MWQKLKRCDFLEHYNLYEINVKLCMMVVLIELYPFTPLSVTLIVFQGRSNKTVVTENLMLKLCMLVDCVK